MESDIFYSQCWEDPKIVFKAIQPSRGDVIVSISSAGDNSLSLLQFPITKVYAVDNNPYQNFVLELKIAAIRNLPREQTLKLLGFTRSTRRFSLFEKLSNELPTLASKYFKRRKEIIEKGIINVGRFENYFRYFRKLILPIFLNNAQINKFLSLENTNEQYIFYKKHWNNYLWRKLFLLFYSKGIMNKIGRHPLFFKYTHINNIGKNYLKRAELGITKIPVRDNYMMEYIMKGRISGKNGYPEYMQREKYSTIKANLSRISVHTTDLFSFLKTLPDNHISGFNLSDVFELFSDYDYENCLEEIYRVSKKGSRICYWQNLVLRELPKPLNKRFKVINSLATDLHSKDRGFFYNRLRILEVVK
ncbi:MAG: DUF3419 family protein [Proteobacteria bacterium]|nr:DUF3419 family protein [Pseudomonadota bacterium]